MSGFEIPEAVIARRVGDETVLVHLDSGRIFTLNQTGSRFWELLQEVGEPGVIEERLQKEFDVDEPVLRREIEGLIRALLAAELLIQTQD